MEKIRNVATIGMFDGVHLGHQYVLQQVVDYARQHGMQALCITFDHSPRREQVLTPLDEKLQLIRQTGIDTIEVLHFTKALKQLTAREFMEQELLQKLNVKVLLTGYDNRFGHNREEGFDDYVRYGEELGIKVLALPAKGSISSSHIRQLLAQGYVSEAAECLGHPYSICGQVTHGEHIGTQLGFPTANIKTAESSQLIPLAGVYAVRVQLERDKELRKGMMNIGTRPTFGEHLQTLEVHVLDYEGNLYGQSIKVEFIRRLREERHFDKPEALIEQLKKDAIEAQQQT
jgi:riboflavin kinase/FMN adenylyltransferase